MDGLKDQLKLIEKNVMDAVWANFVADQFRDATDPADLRRPDLIEDISSIEPTNFLDVEQLMLLTPRIANHYRNRTRRTIIRDLKKLHDMRLIKFEKGLIKPRQEEILAFVPLSNVAPGLS